MSEILQIKNPDDLTKPQQKENSDWIDLRAAEDIYLKEGEYKRIPLGIAVKLPEGYEAHILPRSSTFERYGIIPTNGMGIIDNSYCGNSDIWHFPVWATRDTHIPKDARICQFRIQKIQPNLALQFVEELESNDRKGFGSTGIY